MDARMSGVEFSIHFYEMPRIDLMRFDSSLAMRVTTIGDKDYCQPITIYCTGLDAATIESAVTAFNEAIARGSYLEHVSQPAMEVA